MDQMGFSVSKWKFKIERDRDRERVREIDRYIERKERRAYPSCFLGLCGVIMSSLLISPSDNS